MSFLQYHRFTDSYGTYPGISDWYDISFKNYISFLYEWVPVINLNQIRQIFIRDN